MKKSVSVIIPNYNGKHLLELYVPSVIAALRFSEIVYEIIIVDDQSKDDSADFIRNTYPEIKLLVNDENRGFSYTCNQGIAIAGMDLTFLLNSDVRLTPDYFESQWKYFEDSETFGVMGRIMNKEGTRIEDAARILFYKGCRIKANRFYYSSNPEDKLYTAYLSGANALVDTHKLKELGGFDEIYSPFTSEDSDLCTRAWMLGWKCYYEHQSICYHQVSGSIRTQVKSDFMKKVYFRNRFIFHDLYLTGFRASIWPAYLILLELLPKLVTGKMWILKSYRDYKQTKQDIRESAAKFNKLKKAHQSSLQTSDIMQIINRSLKGKPIIRL